MENQIIIYLAIIVLAGLFTMFILKALKHAKKNEKIYDEEYTFRYMIKYLCVGDRVNKAIELCSYRYKVDHNVAINYVALIRATSDNLPIHQISDEIKFRKQVRGVYERSGYEAAIGFTKASKNVSDDEAITITSNILGV